MVCWIPHIVTESVGNNEFLKRFKNFNITSTVQDIYEFVAADNKNTHKFQEKVWEEANFFFEQKLVNEDENTTSDENEPMDVDTISQKLQASKTLDI